MFDEEQLDPYGVASLPQVLTIKNARIADNLTKFHSISG